MDDPLQTAKTKGTAAGMVCTAGLTLLWIGGWQLLASEIPTSAIVWPLAGFLVLGVVGMPRR